jgi:N-alpha-acetyl-L-2,4-diaminobutyrate deacetylase
MARIVVAPEAVDFESGGRRDYYVGLEHPTLWGVYRIPVTVIVGPGAEPGRGLAATGSTHGDEYEGPIAIKHLLREIREEEVVGRLILIPVLNVVAFKAGLRDTPDDGVNLNRAFPGQARGTITYRIADFVSRFVFPQVHVVLDLHAGGEVARFAPLASMHEISDARQRKAMEDTARGFGTRFTLIYQNATAGLLTSAAESQGKVTLGGEFGWGRALQAEGVSMAKQGVLSAAVKHGQMKGPAPQNRHYAAGEQILVDSSSPESSILAPFDGHFEPSVVLGQLVRKEQGIGFLHDFNRLDDPPLGIVAPQEGHVLSMAWNARVAGGQTIAQVAKVVPWSP